MLAQRIIAYLKRTEQNDYIAEPECQGSYEEMLISNVFSGDYDLGTGSRPPHIVLSTLTAKRPRWLIELCKASALQANSHELKTIDYDSVISSMEDFGYSRMQDLASEYKEQCGQLNEIMKAFTGCNYLFQRTHNLLYFITKTVLDNVDVKIANNKTKARSLEIANLLYSINFLHARIEGIQGEYKHIYFQNRPDLLINEKQAKADELFSWEIHPMFRNALFLKRDGKIGSLVTKRQPKKVRKNRTKSSSGRKKTRR